MLRSLFIIIIILFAQVSHAQVEMANDFRGEGKIYVVIAVIMVILAGFFYLLIKLDRRTKRLEKELEEK